MAVEHQFLTFLLTAAAAKQTRVRNIMAALAVQAAELVVGLAVLALLAARMAVRAVTLLTRVLYMSAVPVGAYLQYRGKMKNDMGVTLAAAEAVMVALEQHPAALLAELVVLAAVEEVLTPAPAVITEVKVKLILVEAAAEKVHMGLIRAAAA